MKIFVANLNSRTTGEDLQELFENYGRVESAKVVIDRDTGNSKRYGFVEMQDERDGNEAIEELDGREFQGAELSVKKSIPRQNEGRKRPDDRRF